MALWSNTDAGVSMPKSIFRGQVTKVNVTAGGTGYTDGAAATFSAPGGAGITATGTVAVTGGVITGVNITNPGSGYSAAPTVTVAGGTGATFNVRIRGAAMDVANVVFVSKEEALLETNKSQGITGAGWWDVRTYTGSNGETRYKTENLVAITINNATSGDATDDAKVPDAEIVIGISVHPADQTTVTGAATFGVTAAFTTGSGTLTYQWQKKAAGATRWANVGGATNATLVLAGQTSGATGDQYRVVVAGSGAKAVTSNAATLTFGT